MNSFSFIARGIDAAVRAQIALHEAGREVVQETYDYDADADTLTPHRSKEEADDYRYFPEPDLVPVEPEQALVSRLRGELPELPAARIDRIGQELGVSDAWALVTPGRDERPGVGDAELLPDAVDASSRQLRQLAAQPRDERLLGLDRNEVGLREIAVVVRFLLGAVRRQRVCVGVVVVRLLDDLPPRLVQRDLRPHRGVDPARDEAERVHVLELPT